MTITTPLPAALRPLGALFSGTDAGIHTLPADVVDLRRALLHLTDTPTPEVPDERALHANLVVGAVAAAHRGDDPPDVTPLVDAGRGLALADARRRVLDEATAVVAGELRDAIIDGAEPILVLHLRPAFDKLIAELKATCAAFLPYGDAAPALLCAPDKARKAFAGLGDLSARWSALRKSRAALASAGYTAQADEFGLFALVRNADSFTDMTQPRPMSKIADGLPWRGLAGTDWQLWIGTNPAAELWLPTPDEQDAAFNALFGARTAAQTRSQQRAGMAHAM